MNSTQHILQQVVAEGPHTAHQIRAKTRVNIVFSEDSNSRVYLHLFYMHFRVYLYILYFGRNMSYEADVPVVWSTSLFFVKGCLPWIKKIELGSGRIPVFMI